MGPRARPGHGHEALLCAYADHEAQAEADTPAALYPDVLARSFHALADQLGAPLSEQDTQRLAVSVPNWPAYPDSHAALAALAACYRLIILSNVDRASFAGSDARLGVRFDAILTAQDVGLLQAVAPQLHGAGRARDRAGHRPGQIAARRPKLVP